MGWVNEAGPGAARPPGGVVPELAELLDRSAHRAGSGSAPPVRTVQGSRSEPWDTISRLRAQARREILSIDDTTYLLAAGAPESIRRRGPATLRSALRRGVAVRQVTSWSGLLADRELGAIVYRDGGQARVTGRVPLKLSVLDRRVALLPVDTTVLADGFRVIRDPGVVAALVARACGAPGAAPRKVRMTCRHPWPRSCPRSPPTTPTT